MKNFLLICSFSILLANARAAEVSDLLKKYDDALRTRNGTALQQIVSNDVKVTTVWVTEKGVGEKTFNKNEYIEYITNVLPASKELTINRRALTSGTESSTWELTMREETNGVAAIFKESLRIKQTPDGERIVEIVQQVPDSTTDARQGPAADGAPKNSADEPVFREPFTLKLQIDKEHFYEEKLPKIPFVQAGDVYLLKDDAFGLSVEIQDNAIHAVKYQPDVKKADVSLKFTQEVQADGTAMMMLVIRNRTKQTLYMDALMTVPNKKGVAKTNVLPIDPGLSGYESWPHAIVQLVLRNIRTTK